MSEPDSEQPPNPRGSLTGLGCALIGLGLLILLPSGLCTAIMGFALITEGLGPDQEGISLLVTFLVIALIGAGLFYAGLQARK